MNRSSEKTWNDNPAIMIYVPVLTVSCVDPTDAIAPPRAWSTSDTISQVTKTIVYVAGRTREKCRPQIFTRRPRQRYMAAVRKAGAIVRHTR